MDETLLKKLLKSSEGLSVEFKSTMYQINHPVNLVAERQEGEMIKDILSLANGGTSTVGKTAYLIIGAENERNPDGSRTLHDIQDPLPDAKDLIAKFRACVEPALEDLDCEVFFLNGKRLIVFTIPPSPYLHETTKDLKAGNDKRYREFSERTVFIRKHEHAWVATAADRSFVGVSLKVNK